MNLLTNKYRYIFVGGKGGVGKTTNSCSLAVQLAARTSSKILLISTDPAHNVSDAFGQQFSSDIQPVNNVPNLFAVEMDPSQKLNNVEKPAEDSKFSAMFEQISSLMKNVSSFPGIDEIMNFMVVMKLAMNDEYETVVFDTAPTGHTMRFLEIPRMAQKLFQTIDGIWAQVQPMMQMMGPMMGVEMGDMDGTFNTVKENLKLCAKVQERFEDPAQTTFVCVCIPEFLSLYETERLVQHLARINIDCNTIIINQVLNVGSKCNCQLCKARSNMQKKYIKQMEELYDDFQLIKMPMLEKEVRGSTDLKGFGDMLINDVKFEK
ncbi:Arsenical_pump-driving ATPase [Hexamita inflata]|uniref:Arsenical pump-driving ATPase n=1 Tax=Hexamita inflata TaxID=28002 RepID=A0AA86PCL7_9EUKA|nr:Arsenical pump-driving ATPase [Hexamita inflata]